MSFTKHSWEKCTYTSDVSQSTAPLGYILDPIRYKHCTPCRFEKGIVGGNNVSVIDGNLVDLENDLRGQTRQLSLCTADQYMPSKSDPKPTLHLKPCMMFDYPEIPREPPLPPMGCIPIVRK